MGGAAALTTSGGSACTSSKGVSSVLESAFNTTTSSSAFSRTLCRRRQMRAVIQSPTQQGLRGTGGRGGNPPLPSPSLGCSSTHLSETSVDSDEVGHGRAVEGTGGRYMP